MKKALLYAGALLVAGMSYGQNDSDVNQTGTNEATIDQMGYNTSVANQTGNSTALVTQIGGNGATTGSIINNNSLINQTGGNDVILSQSGDGNDSNIQQSTLPGAATSRNLVTSEQTGLSNDSDVVQTNEGNFSRMRQTGNNNIIIIDQETPAAGFTTPYNVVDAFQIGDNNMVNNDQDNGGNSHYTFQFGNNNAVVSSQSSDVSGPVITTSPIMASNGYLQESRVIQSGDFNFTNIAQDGSNQISMLFQDADGLAGDPWTNEAYIDQDGYNNFSEINQRNFSTGSPFSANNTATLTQNGTLGLLGNISNIDQQGANTATVNQNN
ncbi:hypothetical protein ULMS_25920 [Patiriisocius marinistellae]|uniref:Curlin associated repeat-containing protein n=1 Tax=Patiriisocius marinistellae TaxID=2494560 RepID=A0A5J4G0N0_9FLAO|nr:hypothetical protein [Patiriisocius marinistellae]GEQ87084.1 hypothetical protein ULMS_25920 [Patiriisocius marinistellae]